MSKDKNINLLAWLLLGISFVFWCVCLYMKFFRFGYFDWDLAIITQALWMLGKGSQYFSLGDYKFFGDHANYIALLFVPLIKILPHPLTLLAVKVIAFHAAALSLYWIAKRFIDAPMALIMMLTFLISPPNVFAMLYEFNFDVIGMALLMWMIYGFIVNNYSVFIWSSLAALLVKENMYLVFITFGLMALIIKKKDRIKWAVVPVVTGTILFYAVMFHFLPMYRELESSAFAFRYDHLGASTGEILRFILLNPFKVLAFMFDPYNLLFLQELFGANLPLSILSPHILLLSAPLFIQHLLSRNAAEHSITSHYSHLLVPFIFLSAVYTLHYLEPRIRKYYGKFGLLTVAVVLILTGWGLLQRRDLLSKQYGGFSSQIAREKWDLIGRIPPEGSVIATLDYTAALSPRKYLYSFHKIYDDRFQGEASRIKDSFHKKEGFQLPPHVAYALIDFDAKSMHFAMADEADTIIPRIERFFLNGAWGVVAGYGTRVLFKRLSPEDEARLEPDDFVFNPLTYFRKDGSEAVMNVRVVK